MNFLIDTLSQEITAHKSMAHAGRAALKLIDVEPGAGDDPVKKAFELLGDRIMITNLSGAFDSIIQSDPDLREELAIKFKKAVDQSYG